MVGIQVKEKYLISKYLISIGSFSETVIFWELIFYPGVSKPRRKIFLKKISQGGTKTMNQPVNLSLFFVYFDPGITVPHVQKTTSQSAS